MNSDRHAYKVALLLGAAAFLLTLAAGVLRSLFVEERLPQVDLPQAGMGERIEALLARQEYPAAIEQLQFLSKFYPHDPRPHERLGLVLAELGRVDDAREEFHAALALMPQSAQIHNYLGATYLQADQPELALPWFEKALVLQPGYTIARDNLERARGQMREQRPVEP